MLRLIKHLKVTNKWAFRITLKENKTIYVEWVIKKILKQKHLNKYGIININFRTTFVTIKDSSKKSLIQ